MCLRLKDVGARGEVYVKTRTDDLFTDAWNVGLFVREDGSGNASGSAGGDVTGGCGA